MGPVGPIDLVLRELLLDHSRGSFALSRQLPGPTSICRHTGVRSATLNCNTPNRACPVRDWGDPARELGRDSHIETAEVVRGCQREHRGGISTIPRTAQGPSMTNPPPPFDPSAPHHVSPPPPRRGIIPLHPIDFGTLFSASFAVIKHNPKLMFGTLSAHSPQHCCYSPAASSLRCRSCNRPRLLRF